MNTDDKGYHELRIAIIQQANKDYLAALKSRDSKSSGELEKFYRSPWGEFLTWGNGEHIITRLRRELKNAK